MTAPEFAVAMAMCSDRVVKAVHDEDRSAILVEIRQALTLTAPDGVDPVVALVTVLAAQVPTGQPLRSRLRWVTDLDVEQVAS